MNGKVAVLFSGGKDSTLAAFYTSSMGFETVLVTFSPSREDSYMLHKPCLSLTPLQAEAMDMERFAFEVSGDRPPSVSMRRHVARKVSPRATMDRTAGILCRLPRVTDRQH